MITRQEAVKMWEEIADMLLNKLTTGFDCLDARNKFLSQFSNEPTPDQMLKEMRQWAIDHDYYFRYTDSISGGKELEFTLFMKFYPENLFCCGSTRKATITEAYRRFKEAVK